MQLGFGRRVWLGCGHPSSRGVGKYHPPSVSMSGTGSRRVNGGSLAFVFLIHTCRVMLDVSPTLTTTTLNDSRMGWFEAGS